MVGLAIIPQPGTNYLDVASAFYSRLKELKEELPRDLKLDIAKDNTQFIRMSVTEVGETILISLVL